MAIHEAEDVTAHVQSRVVLTSIVPFAPAAGADDTELVAVTPHLTVVGASTLTDDEPQAAARTDRRTAEASRIQELPMRDAAVVAIVLPCRAGRATDHRP